MKILNPRQIREADQYTIKHKSIPSIELMEHAASLCSSWLMKHISRETKIHIFCGVGNNGGDGLVIARHLLDEIYFIKAYVVHFSDNMSDDFITNYQRAEDFGLKLKNIYEADDFPEISDGDVVIDSIFGMGLSKAPRGIAKDIIAYINRSGATVFAIDMPSGLYADKDLDKGQEVIKNAHVLTFETPKLNLLLPDFQEYVKDFTLLDIGLDKNFINSFDSPYHFITVSNIQDILKPRSRFSHKGSFGHVLLMGGSYGKIGAIVLASKAALRSGSGLVTAYVPKCAYEIMQISIPEVMVEVDAESQLEYFNYKTEATIIGIGPGLGTDERTQKALGAFLEKNKLPLVLDADALNILSLNTTFLDYIPKNAILTPHPGELKRLIGDWANDYVKMQKAQAFAQKYQCILVIKGAHTIIVDEHNFYFNSTGNPALAKGGSGDVLTGMITGFLAQGYSALEAAQVAVFLHGATADGFKGRLNQITFTASDIIRNLTTAMTFLFDFTEEEEDFLEDYDDDDIDDYFFDDEGDIPF